MEKMVVKQGGSSLSWRTRSRITIAMQTKIPSNQSKNLSACKPEFYTLSGEELLIAHEFESMKLTIENLQRSLEAASHAALESFHRKVSVVAKAAKASAASRRSVTTSGLRGFEGLDQSVEQKSFAIMDTMLQFSQVIEKLQDAPLDFEAFENVKDDLHATLYPTGYIPHMPAAISPRQKQVEAKDKHRSNGVSKDLKGITTRIMQRIELTRSCSNVDNQRQSEDESQSAMTDPFLMCVPMNDKDAFASVTEFHKDLSVDMFQIGRMPCRQNDFVIPGPRVGASGTISLSTQLDRLNVQCPVQLHPLRFTRVTPDEDIPLDQIPHVFPACGHVFGFEGRIASSHTCPLCRTPGSLVQLLLKENSQLQPAEEQNAIPECVFNPCGHAISSKLAQYYSTLLMPNGRAICPFCAVHLDLQVPFSRLYLYCDSD
ncbi:hypothetical protein BBJ29_004997 [Phytophthora kernoviae]|uniref:Pellino RING domain-containing protein n=1 Tax=Phytophthora kernoviae TaxID=325452 RepID=A0A3F2S0L9_9STRA|nr:hypothetical protein BBP00_00001833 [Phytophthora kernoviae]RLN71838.1 hypothetical protein BBJ29_004997 [Phytophthora kernoviae]